MPDHIHILAEGKAKSADLCMFVNIAKQRSAFVARRWIRGRLWQAGYFDRVLREDDSAFAVARYIVQNPVRAGLVRSPVEYPFCGSSVWSKEELVESTMWRPGAP
jgi:REP element-mobilizing transposase RayT